MQAKTLTLFVSTMATIYAATFGQVPVQQPAPLRVVQIPAVDPLADVNAYRARSGLPPLAFDPYCDQLAATNNAHQRGRGMGHYVAGWQCVAMGSASPSAAVAQWIASGPHRAILLSRSITRAAVRVEGGYATFQAR